MQVIPIVDEGLGNSVAAVTAASGLDVVVRMCETLPRGTAAATQPS